MKRTMEVARIVSGLFIVVSGLMLLGLFGWEPPIAGPEARPFQMAMHEAGYFLPIITGVFLLTGAALVANVYGALAALLLAPVSINILLFHVVLEAGQLPIAVIFFCINCLMLYYYKGAYGPLFKPRLER